MSKTAISRFPIPDLDSLPDDIQQRIEAVNEKVNDQDLLCEHGFDEDDIWDIGSIAAFFGLSNRLVNMSSMRTNDEIYLMGRVPR